MKTKICNTCYKTKELEAFNKEKDMPDGRRNKCRNCRAQEKADWRKNNRERYNKYMRDYNARNPVAYRMRVHRYGITKDDYEKMFIKQNGCCAICKRVPKHNLYVDHCHKTKKVRGLLCASCNRSIHILDNNPDLLKSSLEYLNQPDIHS